MSEPTHRFVQTNGIRMHLAEQGEGPVVLLCHGWPESWYSWRHQLTALAEAGFHAVAPDMRGYGQTDQPTAVDQYSLFHLVGDMVGVLDALGSEQAVIVGHDWGAPVAWHSAMVRPDRFRAVAGLSVPFRPRGSSRPTDAMPRTADAQFYQLYFQSPGVAEAELQRDVRQSLLTILTAGADPGGGNRGRAPAAAPGMVPSGGGFLDAMQPAPELPGWLTPADIDRFTAEFERAGFAGGLNWYRNIDRNWELTAPYAGAKVTVPALYMVGDRDLVYRFPGMDRLIPALRQFVPQLRDTVILPGCGHWTQQERATDVNAALIGFLRGL